MGVGRAGWDQHAALLVRRMSRCCRRSSHLILICCFDELVERLAVGGMRGGGGPLRQKQRERGRESLLVSFMGVDMWLAASSRMHVGTLAITWA